MRYPVMTEKHLADRWQVSLKTLQRWRADGEGPISTVCQCIACVTGSIHPLPRLTGWG